MALAFAAGSVGAKTLDAYPTATVTVGGKTFSPAALPAPNATPRCFVDIYPYEGGKLSFSDQDPTLVSVGVTDTVRGLGSGFTITLGPGGPNGTSIRPSWAEVLTPMSLVVIGMQRGVASRIVMIGVVKGTREDSQRRMEGSRRYIQVYGSDFSEFFNTFTWYNMAALAGLNGTALGNLGYLSSIDVGLTFGSPDSLGKAWFKFMAGPQGFLSRTRFTYQNGTSVSFSDMVSTVFEPYTDSQPLYVPQSADFMGEGTLASKFGMFFPFPWYDLFLTTAPAGAYAGLTGLTVAKTPISMTGFTDANPTFVARVNPLPRTHASDGSLSPTFLLDNSRWQALPIYSLDLNTSFGTRGERDFVTVWGSEEVRNFYIINPTILSRAYGSSNSSIVPFLQTYAGWVDVSSMHRYGYRPQITETAWFTDPTGLQAQQSAQAGFTEDQFAKMVSDLALRVTSYHQPAALMARADVVTELRPDILPGTRFTHAPYRDGTRWNYYIESVSHTYEHGGMCVTSLSLTRGLPEAVYEDADMLTAVLTGNAQRANGVYVKGVPPGTGNSLTPLNFSTIQSVVADNAAVYSAPQANTPASNPLIQSGGLY